MPEPFLDCAEINAWISQSELKALEEVVEELAAGAKLETVRGTMANFAEMRRTDAPAQIVKRLNLQSH